MKKLFPVFALMILVSLVGFQTLAYFTTQTATENHITTGDLEMALYSMTVNSQDELVAIDAVIQNILPGDTYIQKPFVENTGDEAFYARVYFSSTITSRDDEEMENPLEFNIDEDKWKKDGDGWYRYVDIIEPGETTAPLFTEVFFPGDKMGNEYVGSTTNITLQGQSVQATNNQHDNVLDVQGWPASGGNT